MNRRQSLSLLALIPAGGAFAQTGSLPAKPALSGPEQAHASETMEAGFVARETSLLALSKGTSAAVKRFAQAEAAEQQTVGAVLKMRAGLPENAKPNVTAEGKATIDKLHDSQSGPEFDKAYIAAQIEGHQKLLKIQETYLSAGKDPASTAIAMLARGHIKEHLSNLEMIRNELPA